MPLPALGFLAQFGLASQGIQGLAQSAKNVAAAFVSLPNNVAAFGDGLVRGQEALRQFSGDIATAFGKMDVAERQLSYQQAAVTGEGTAALVNEVIELKRNLAPFQALITKGFNQVATVVVNGLNGVIKMLEYMPGIAGWVEEIKLEMEKTTADPGAAVTFLNDIAAGKFTGRVTDRGQVHTRPAGVPATAKPGTKSGDWSGNDASGFFST